MHWLVRRDIKRGHERRDRGCPCKLSSCVDSNDIPINQTLDNILQGNALVCFVANGMMKSTISSEVIPLRDQIRKRTRSWLPQQGLDQRIDCAKRFCLRGVFMRLTPRPPLLSLARLHSSGRKGRVCSDGDFDRFGINEILNSVLQGEAHVD